MRWITVLLAAVLLAGCSWGQPKPPPQPETPPKTPAEVEKVLGARAREVVNHLKSKDVARIAGVIHPEKGVRFSQYGHVNTTSDLVFGPQALKDAWNNKRLYQWGTFDGSGDPINLGVQDYFNRFVYDVDFAAAPQMGWGVSIGKGNTTDNWKEAYPDGVMVEFHFPQIDPKYEGMDWRSLRLVFEKKGSEWMLVGIIHAQWTI
ncbi:MAG: hypothetical protein K0R39_4118 [Symbiobacteriaceae bacterium]|jgi:hypothetical protein|nr:hypothetical protein [Symbiobacteriaceae bacterium]